MPLDLFVQDVYFFWVWVLSMDTAVVTPTNIWRPCANSKSLRYPWSWSWSLFTLQWSWAWWLRKKYAHLRPNPTSPQGLPRRLLMTPKKKLPTQLFFPLLNFHGHELSSASINSLPRHLLVHNSFPKESPTGVINGSFHHPQDGRNSTQSALITLISRHPIARLQHGREEKKKVFQVINTSRSFCCSFNDSERVHESLCDVDDKSRSEIRHKYLLNVQ